MLLTLLASAFGYSTPPYGEIQFENANFTKAVPIERRADLAFTLKAGGEPVASFIGEVQLDVDLEKSFAWPFYAASLHARLRCPTYLVVLTPSLAVASWARRSIATFQPNSPFCPIVIGPTEIPRTLTDEEARGMPELAVLVALFRRDEREAVETAVRTLVGLDDVRARTYLDLVYSVVGDLARVALEALMRAGYEYKSDFAKKYVAEGREQGLSQGLSQGRAEEARRALYAVLAARSIDATPARKEIETCDELASLETWLVRAAVASTIEEVLAPKRVSRKTGAKRTKR